MLKFTEFPEFNALLNAVAQRWLAAVASQPVCRTFALAGGTTPSPLYRKFDQLLASTPSARLQLIATDERWVDDSDPQSNEGLIRQCFAGSAGQWQLVSLKNAAAGPVQAVPDISSRIGHTCPEPFGAVLLGMGTDGHVASLFPDAPELLVPNRAVHCVAARHPQSGQERMSLSLSRLLHTEAIWLIITGAEKRRVLEQAGPRTPIGAVLAQASCDIEVFWCP